ncbi:MAG: tetratricopeptide repeat protein [bacterium]
MSLGRAPLLDPALEKVLSEIRLHIRQGNFDGARSRLAEAQALAPEHPRVLEIEGDLYAGQRKFKPALDAYKKAFAIDPKNARLEEKYATAVVKVNMPTILAHTPIDVDDDAWWINPMVPPRVPWQSAMLSAFLPGVGQWHNGETLKSMIIFAVAGYSASWVGYALYMNAKAFTSTRLNNGFFDILSQGLHGANLVFTIIWILIWLYAIIDAAMVASAANEQRRRNVGRM